VLHQIKVKLNNLTMLTLMGVEYGVEMYKYAIHTHVTRHES